MFSVSETRNIIQQIEPIDIGFCPICMCFLKLRTDSSRGRPFLFFSDYFQSFKDTITYYISYERVYFSLFNYVNHILIVHNA